jgi:hypothetical protein
LIANEYISSRITELKTTIADGVVKAEIRLGALIAGGRGPAQ